MHYFDFHYSWEQRKLNEVAEFNPKSELPDEFEYVDLESVVGTEMISHRTETKDSAPSRAQRLAQPGDVFFQTVRPYQKNNYLFSKLDNNYVFSTGYAQMRPNIDTAFLMSFLQTDSFVKIVLDNCTGTSYPAINSSDLSNLEISLPKSFEEQKKVGKTIISIDNLITLHQCKCQIDGCRFQSPLAITWEQRKLSEIATMHARIGWQNLRTSEFLDSGDYMLITGTDFIDGAVNFDTCHYVERERYEQDKHIQIRNGSILITKDGTLGKVAYIQGLTMPATLNAGVFNVEIKDENEVDNRYLFQYLKAPFLMDYVDKKATGGTIKHLNQNILVDFPVVLPHKAEQEKIGEYFLAIDHLITLHQCE